MARVELTVDAERDLVEIYLHGLEHFGYASTERYVEALHELCPKVGDGVIMRHFEVA